MSSEGAAQFNIHDAKTNLSRIIERVEHGEEIIISRAGHPVAKVIPLTRRVDRTGRGTLRGRLVATEDRDSPEVNEAIAAVREQLGHVPFFDVLGQHQHTDLVLTRCRRPAGRPRPV